MVETKTVKGKPNVSDMKRCGFLPFKNC